MNLRSVAVIIAPFHVGVPFVRVGNGPDCLLAEGIIEALEAAGLSTALIRIEPVDAFEGEIGRSFEVKRRVAREVAAAARSGRFPLVLAGNCNTSVGVLAGLNETDLGLVWFDAHPDFDTPDECLSGYFDGMGVATLAGQCWHKLAATLPGFKPFNLDRLIYCGVRDFEHGQREKVEAHRIKTVFGSMDHRVDFVTELERCLTGLPPRALVHLDLDCLDTSVGLANSYAAPGGLLVEDLRQCLAAVRRRTIPIAMTIASFDPSMNGSERIAAAGVMAAMAIVAP